MRISHIRRRLNSVSPQVLVFLLALAFTGAQGGIFHTTFNNFLADTYNISAGTRGLLEFPRELPGLLVTLFAGLLVFLPETRVGGIALFCTGIGLLGLGGVGFIKDVDVGWPIMILFMFIWSIGNHLIMPVRESVGMSLGDESQRGRKLGQVRTFGAFGAILGAGAVWLITDVLRVPSHQLTAAGQPMPAYWLVFPCGALFGLIAAVLFMRIRDVGMQTKRSRLIIRRRYWLYYVLSALFGARKQIFITFAPWVLVRIFGQPPATFAKLWIVSALCSLLFIPTVGKLIDRFGERAVLMVDALVIICICMVYGFAYHWGLTGIGLWLTFVCYILDHLLFAVGMARSTYVSKIVTDPDHVPASVSMGVTLDHVMGMSVPALGGYVWMAYGHEWVFVGAAGIAILMCIFSSRIRVPGRATAQ